MAAAPPIKRLDVYGVQALLRKTSFLGWSFRAVEDQHFDIRVFITATPAPNADDVFAGRQPGTVTPSYSFTLPSGWTTEDHFLHALHSALVKMVVHEVDEFLAVDGKRPFHPHAGGQV